MELHLFAFFCLMCVVHSATLLHKRSEENEEYGIIEDKSVIKGMENPELFEGDIDGFDPHGKGFINDKNKVWPNSTIPYVIDASLTNEAILIKDSLKVFEKKTCLRFVARNGEKNYMEFYKGTGCHSPVGMNAKEKNLISLGNGCQFRGKILHETMHSLGFYHEHSRPDRNKYVTIIKKNIKEGAERNFRQLSTKDHLDVTPFDQDSIMMYGNFAFSKDPVKFKTIVAKNKKPLLDSFFKGGISAGDAKRLNLVYCKEN